MTPRTPASSKLETITLMTPEMSNFGGSVHGGHVLRLVDQIAYACAASYSSAYCVTRSVDRVDFRVAIPVGSLLILQAQVNFVGRTSMEVGVRAETRDLRSGDRRHTNPCFLTMVALDDDGRPTPVPPLDCETDEDRRRFTEARRRRQRALLLRTAEESETRHRELIDAARVAIVLAEAEGGAVIDANQPARDLLDREEDAQGALWTLFASEAEGRAVFDRAVEGGFVDGDYQVRTGAGDRVLRVTAFVLPVPGSDLVQAVLRAPD